MTNDTAVESGTSVFALAQREKLLELREVVVEYMTRFTRDDLRSLAAERSSAFGLHQVDAGSDAHDRDLVLRALSQDQDTLYEIDQALERIELGTYGICEMSGEEISQQRLEAIPFARFTVECQARLEKQIRSTRVPRGINSLFDSTTEPCRA